ECGPRDELGIVRPGWVKPNPRKVLREFGVGDSTSEKPAAGAWITFPSGAVEDGRGDDAVLRLAPSPVKTRFLRILMTESSNTCDTHGSNDPRNCVGYAVNEIYVGNFTAGRFIDLITHTPGQSQTSTMTSSMDP